MAIIASVSVVAGGVAAVTLLPSGDTANRRIACDAQLGEFLEALQGLDGRLSVGLTYADYSARVGDVAAVHAKIDAAEIDDGDCLTAGAAGEKAIQFYAKAGDIWSNCIQSSSCSTSSIEPRLQTQWTFARGRIERMQNDLDALGDPE